MDAKAARVPSCERAGAGARESANSLNAGVCVTSAEISRKPAPAPAAATSALVSKASRDPSPLMVGLRLIVPGCVCVTRRTPSSCELTRATGRQRETEKITAKAQRLRSEGTPDLLYARRGERLAGHLPGQRLTANCPKGTSHEADGARV